MKLTKGISLTDRIIFGLKAKQLRLARGLSFAELSKASGMSLSYLNEIEKGKKFPKKDKIVNLADALGTTPGHLTDGKLAGPLAPVEQLLRSNFLNELQLDIFGIQLNKVAELIARAPVRVAAFISTLLELSRTYNLGEQSFYFGALRAYLELHDNFFPELEKAVEDFAARHALPSGRSLPPRRLAEILEREYGYRIEEGALEREADLRRLRAVFLPRSRRLLLQNGLAARQKVFQYGKEIGFNYLGLAERADTSSLFNARSFEEVINHSKATYFSAALALPLEPFAADIADFFAAPRWNPDVLPRLLDRYNVNPETLYHRLTNVLPHRFGFTRLFFLRFVHDPATDRFKIDRELHLDRGNHPRGNARGEHYCRRWLSTAMLMDMEHSTDQSPRVAAQRSHYHGTDSEYLCLTLARHDYPRPGRNVSVTLGLLINDDLRAFCNWVDDPALPRREVNLTCEHCPITDCAERAAPPSALDKRRRLREIRERIAALDHQPDQTLD